MLVDPDVIRVLLGAGIALEAWPRQRIEAEALGAFVALLAILFLMTRGVPSRNVLLAVAATLALVVVIVLIERAGLWPRGDAAASSRAAVRGRPGARAPRSLTLPEPWTRVCILPSMRSASINYCQHGNSCTRMARRARRTLKR